MPHLSLDNPLEGHRKNQGVWETESKLGAGDWKTASSGHTLTLDTEFPSGGAGFTFITGQQFRAEREADGSMFVFDTSSGKRIGGELAPAAPPNPVRPNIIFFQDPNTGTFFAFDKNADLATALTVISEEAVGEGFQHILDAASAVSSAGLNADRYDYVFKDGRVVPILRDTVPPGESSFFTSTDASGQLLVIDRKTGKATPIGATPVASQVPPGATVELDPVTGQFKVTQPNGTISFLQAPVDFKPPQEVTIGGQSFAFNPNTGGFQQVQIPAQQFDPGVVTKDGRAFIQGPGGNLTPLGREEVPNLDELINARILAGDASGALALADFRDRPTSLEAFNAAMQFAQSPGDVAAISAISRGQSLVASPPSGTVQRIAEQPEFLQDAFSRLINQFRGGSGSPEQFIDVLTRINKEFADSKAELRAASEKNRQSELQTAIDKAIAPFRTEVSGLREILSGIRGEAKGAATPTDIPPTDVEAGVPEVSAPTDAFEGDVFTGGPDDDIDDVFFAKGGITEGANLEIVGEGGQPELVDLPPGTRVTPISKLSTRQVQKLREMGIRGMQRGGIADSLLNRTRQFISNEDPGGVPPPEFRRIPPSIGDGETEFFGTVEGPFFGAKPGQPARPIEDFIPTLPPSPPSAPPLTSPIRATSQTSSVGGVGGGTLPGPQGGGRTLVSGEDTAPIPIPPGFGAGESPGVRRTLAAPRIQQQARQLFNSTAFNPDVRSFAVGSIVQTNDGNFAVVTGYDGEFATLVTLSNFGDEEGSPFGGGALIRQQASNIRVSSIEAWTDITGRPPPDLQLHLDSALKRMGRSASGDPGDSTQDSTTSVDLPFGVRRALAGVAIEPTRRRLSTAAGIPVLSAQARQNLLPEELEVFNRLSREAGIPEGAFRQEQESAFPGANLARGRARSAPRVRR